MVTRVSRRAIGTWLIQANERTRSIDFWLSVTMGGRGFTSTIFVCLPPSAWEPSLIAQVFERTRRWHELLQKERGVLSRLIQPSTSEQFHSLQQDYESAKKQSAWAHEQLQALSPYVTDSDAFLRFMINPVPVTPAEKDDRFYAFEWGTLWSCKQELTRDQWGVLVARFREREQGELAAALSGPTTDGDKRSITAGVRRAVWIRDRGQCARCGSRKPLEFDHVVPVSRGGSNTERNIELLCEICNRAKSNSIS